LEIVKTYSAIPEKRTILMYGRSNAGKTAQIGELAEHVKKTLGLNTRLYTADKGGLDTIRPYVDLGIIEPVELGTTDPWIFLNKAVRGCVRGKDGKWVAGDNSKIGCFAFESLRSFAENLMEDMKKKAAQNVNIGGGSNISFTINSEGETLKVSGSNMAHFGVAQGRMMEEVWESQKLNAPYICWTSSVSKDEDTNAAGKILGPDVIGKALTAEVPRWFSYTFRLDVIPAQMGQKERHLLYLGNHVDVGAGGANGLGNIRMPLDSKPLEKNVIEPASIVKALELIEGGRTNAVDAIKKRLGL
jgi:hypothetical protein